ncbi:MAG: dodecin family protein [Defluviicoccus sp.]|nr:MAG: dodecin family protein [Defluviicoccus sp.]
MPNSVYKKLELVGTSSASISEAINNAIGTASGEIENITWFEVAELRGHVDKGAVSEYQVVLKVGYRISE